MAQVGARLADCPTVAKFAGDLSGHQHCRGWGGPLIPTSTSAHPSVHHVPHQEQPSGSPAGHRCPAVQGSHRKSSQRVFSWVLQPAVPGAEEDRRSMSSHWFIHAEQAHGSVSLQDGNPGIRESHHQKPGVDSLHRHKRCLSPCPNAQGHRKVFAICGQQEDVPIQLSALRIGHFTLGVYEAAETSRSLVKTARCHAARLLRRLADPCRYSRTGPAACPDDHQPAAVSRLDHQLREVQPNT